ncbi:MAG: phosphatidylserine decarboxylase family protein [Nitrospinota bacterium]|nr:phosphatidylserine decarboxylase family protein [Nitrospinota bacterium]
MPFDRECLLFVIPLALVAIVLLAFGLVKSAMVALGLAAFVLFFFRDPQRVIPADESLIISPADGRVIRIDTAYQSQDHPQGSVCVSIFLSIFNVHVQRAPIAGVVDSKKYHSGSFLAAWNHKASEDNEHNLTIFDTAIGKVGVKQIAGLVARRVVTRVSVGQALAKGEHIGLIRFGSRVDLILPPGMDLISKLGDKVKGGESVMARIPADRLKNG